MTARETVAVPMDGRVYRLTAGQLRFLWLDQRYLMARRRTLVALQRAGLLLCRPQYLPAHRQHVLGQIRSPAGGRGTRGCVNARPTRSRMRPPPSPPD